RRPPARVGLAGPWQAAGARGGKSLPPTALPAAAVPRKGARAGSPPPREAPPDPPMRPQTCPSLRLNFQNFLKPLTVWRVPVNRGPCIGVVNPPRMRTRVVFCLLVLLSCEAHHARSRRRADDLCGRSAPVRRSAGGPGGNADRMALLRWRA